MAIEICEHEGIDYDRAEENAIHLIILLMNELGLSIDQIVPHQKWTGKYCPHIILDNGWDNFIERIENTIKEIENNSTWSEDAKQWVIKNGISDGQRPKEYATREEVWTMLYRAFHN